jgi:hypothetical protein
MESVPGVPGHVGAALSADLLVSDAAALASKIDPVRSVPRGACATIEDSYGTGNHLLKDSTIGFYASIWPTYQALDAFLLTAQARGEAQCVRDYEQTLAAVDLDYWARGVRGMPAAYDQGPAALHLPGDLPRVDDSLWMGLTELAAYHRTRDASLLRRAEAVLALARANWDPEKGGVYWEDHPSGATRFGKAVVSNAPAAVLALELYLLTGQRADLAWGERIVTWLRANLLDPSAGLYDDTVDDHVRPPRVSHARFTYDDGMVIEALAVLHTVSPSRYPLADAVSLAQRSMGYFRVHHSYGQPSFDVIWVRSLLWLAALDRRPSFTAQARASLRAALTAEPGHPGGLLDSAAELALQDLAALPPRSYGELAP